MLSSSEVRALCPSISFLFTRLGGSLDIFPYLERFILEDSGLCIVLGDLLQLLCQSINWFKGLIKEWGVMSEVRSSELETRLPSSDRLVEGDTAIYAPREVRAFHALEEVCGLDGNTLSRFKDRFHFPDRVRVRLPSEENGAYHFLPGRYASTRLPFFVGLGSLSILLSWSCWAPLVLLLGNLCPICGG